MTCPRTMDLLFAGSEGMGVELLQSINHENKYFMAAGIVNRQGYIFSSLALAPRT